MPRLHRIQQSISMRNSNLDIVELTGLVPGLEIEHAEPGPALQPRQGEAHVAVRGGAEPLVAVQPQHTNKRIYSTL